MSKSDAFETDLLKLLFNATPVANVADNALTAPLTTLYVSLHTASPGEAGTQITNETTYTGYARIGVARTAAGWVVGAVGTGTVSPAADVVFPSITAGTGTITHAAVGAALTGTGKIFYYGVVTPNIPIVVGVQPTITASSTITED